MLFNRRFVGVAVTGIFVIGAGYIVYSGRPIMNLPVPTGTTGTPSSSTTNGSPAGSAQTYTMADIQTHRTRSSCWSAIGGDVYDLTSWISRHPGGEDTIIGLCGTDGTAAYTNQHRNSRRPKSVLALLKIGSLK